jgi:hypothetical protein
MILDQYPPGFLLHTEPYLDVSVVFKQRFKNHYFLLEAMRAWASPFIQSCNGR